ncbi:hypothetical protein PTSG_01556 [Salpingoeca rosetta]|uniref:Uncharacterized protein n=1 Tax=Salpingoeca rosetta (strain ATCC 50818 / BSB-021) TaxID=946362 RepID=F2U0P6_SALR5|nr:uncharacterized protein PTSG_01556 [Salpingoeca rosetta]EGD80974.1 hypothetical protein PTSG_01556 [Salpingoeca rosetta]|eukprot:XP_004997535.1 hypothetical protein PTSG_01556 [Salpingoeca rosetta]
MPNSSSATITRMGGQPEPAKVSRHTIVLIWLMLTVAALICLIVGLASPRLISGTVLVQGNATEYTAKFLFSSEEISWWKASSSAFMLSVLGTVLTIVLLLRALGRMSLVPYAQTAATLTNVAGVSGMMCLAAGFAYLDDSCEQGGRTENCDLACAPDEEMSFFILCRPYDVDAGMFLLILGVFLGLVGAITSMCLRIPLYREPPLPKQESFMTVARPN